MIRPGDVLVLGDVIAEVDSVRVGAYWLDDGEFGDGVAIGWTERGGSARGVLIRAADATMYRLVAY